jgi:hypothetical protein
MNRTLRRPMFRMGGSAEGITSGLDAPDINKRQSYEFGKTVQNIRRDMPGLRELYEENMAPRGSNFSDFLINLGLDLASRPRSGNIFQQVATSAREPFAQFQARKEAYRSEDDKLSRALIGDLLDRETRLEEARIDAEGEKGGKKGFEYKGKYNDYSALLKEQRNLEDQQNKLQKDKEAMPSTIDSSILDNQIEQIKRQIEDNAKKQSLFVDAEEDETRKAILAGIPTGVFTFEDLIVYDETGVPPKQDDSFATGGRVGLQMGGEPMQAAQTQGQMPMDQGTTQDSPVQNLSFEELRSRLPNSITDDIITLIANSEQALVDFANIQTQQDVNAFNQKYEVNLQMPAEA